MWKLALRTAIAAGCAALAAGAAMSGGGEVRAATVSAALVPPGAAAPVSVMSYNVEGLPPPARFGRSDSINRIGAGLALMRGEGRQPHVVLLQEAFRGTSDHIAQAGGYRYRAHGPSADAVNDAHPPDGDAREFAATASLLKGESAGKWLDSGLAILSDYPIVRVERTAFPRWACAGFDCLANKGVLIAWIAMPGARGPVAFVDTHLNSRKASGVDPVRADRAYAYQLQNLRSLLRARIPASRPVFLGGDFNVGRSPTRLAIARQGLLVGAHDVDVIATHDPSLVPEKARPDFNALVQRDKDFLFFRGSERWPLKMARLTVPFGQAANGPSLSDHLGYAVTFSSR